jgi:hypothetical protein
MAKPLSREVKELALALFLQGFTMNTISSQTGVSLQTLSKWRGKQNWNTTLATVKANQAKGMCQAATLHIGPASNGTNGSAGRLRERLAEQVSSAVAQLEQNPANSHRELRNTPEREGRASVLKRLVDSAALIEDWEGSKGRGLVVVGQMLGTAPDSSPVIDLQQPAQLTSVPEASGLDETPEDALAALAAGLDE